MANPKSNETLHNEAAQGAYIVEHKNAFIAGLVVLALIIVAIFGGKKWMDGRESKAQTYLTQGQTYMAQGEFAKALNGEGKYPGFTKIAADYSFTDAANLANYFAGLCYFKEHKIKEAIQALESFSPQNDHSISAQATAALANAYAQDGQIEKAADTFLKAADIADNAAMSPEFLVQAGELFIKADQKDKALKAFKEVKEEFPTSVYAQPNTAQNGTISDPLIDSYIERLSK